MSVISPSGLGPVVRRLLLLAAVVCAGCERDPAAISGALPWARHTIDDRFRGADGVKPADANADGLPDLVVGWEESGAVVVYLNPGPAQAAARWPAVTVGRVGDVEDAVFADLDADGRLDVVSCCEGDVKTMFVHWAPPDASDYDNPGAWQTEALPATAGQRKWMFCQPAQIDGVRGIDLVAGARGDNGRIGYLAAPDNPRDLSAWSWQPLADARWIMSIIPVDLDGDGDLDIVYTDRKGDARGAYWLENPGPGGGPARWGRHQIGSASDELMFMDLGDLDGDGRLDAVAATDGRGLFRWQPTPDVRLPWLPAPVSWPDSFGTGKGVRLGDLDLDGKVDLAFTCENAGSRIGVGRLMQQDLAGLSLWTARPISGTGGGKFDLIQLLDLDADGDLDLVTTEESAGLGVVWYENPILSP